ncbi:hypothetical protein ACTAQJ_07955 [Arthrobacter sp. alpha11c]
MRKIWGLILLVSVGLTGCSSAGAGSTPSSEPSTSDTSSAAAPLLAAPAPAEALPSAFTDESARARFLEGVKKNWRGGNLPSDDALVQRGAESCALFDQGLTMGEIGERGGSTEIEWDNAGAIAVYASRVFCTKHNTDNL